MKIEKQVTSLELSQKLKELGYPQESLFYWHLSETKNKRDFDDVFEYNWYIELAGYIDPSCDKEKSIPAPTVAELGNKLYEIFNKQGYDLLYKAYGECFDFKGTQRIGDIGIINLMRKPDMAAKMLIYLLENKLIEL